MSLRVTSDRADWRKECLVGDPFLSLYTSTNRVIRHAHHTNFLTLNGLEADVR